MILTQEEEMKNIFIGAVNASDVQKGMYFYVGEHSCYLIQFNRRNMLNVSLIPYGIYDATKVLSTQGTLDEKVKAISNSFNEFYEKIDFGKKVDSETEVLCNGNLMRSIGKIARKATKYPLDLENNYVLSTENFNNVYALIESLGVDKTKKIKGISSESSDKILQAQFWQNVLSKTLGLCKFQ